MSSTSTDEEVYHSTHPHKLKLDIGEPYLCNGCKEMGYGPRYRCKDCDFDLHKECALAAPTITHPFYEDSVLVFLTAGKIDRRCNACWSLMEGFMYHCSKTDIDLHPGCAKLPLNLDVNGVKLHLKQRLSTECSKCGMVGNVGGWSYSSTNDQYHFHLSCLLGKVSVEVRQY